MSDGLYSIISVLVIFLCVCLFFLKFHLWKFSIIKSCISIEIPCKISVFIISKFRPCIFYLHLLQHYVIEGLYNSPLASSNIVLQLKSQKFVITWQSISRKVHWQKFNRILVKISRYLTHLDHFLQDYRQNCQIFNNK